MSHDSIGKAPTTTRHGIDKRRALRLRDAFDP
jgi:hypothetical protein